MRNEPIVIVFICLFSLCAFANADLANSVTKNESSIKQAKNPELGGVHDANWMKIIAEMSRQPTQRWIVQLHKTSETPIDGGFRNRIKSQGAEKVGSELVQITRDLSDPIPYQSVLPKSSPVHNLVVVQASRAAIQSLLREGKIVSAEIDSKMELYKENLGHPIYKLPKMNPMPYFLPFTMNDPLWVDQWGLGQSGFNQVRQNFPVSSSQTAGRSLIFVIDSWVDASHEDLNANNFINLEGPFMGTGLPSYHGTHVTGIMAAISNNSKGVAGALNSATIVPIEVCDNTDVCDDSLIIKALYFAADGLPNEHIPRVVNMSLGGPEFSPQVFSAIKYAQSKDVLIVAAAGNSSNPALGTYPASYPDVISVGASTPDTQIASFSNYGQNSLTILAPGTNIASTIPRASADPSNQYSPTLINNTPYAYLDGTSMATPFVTAAAALLRANQPSFPQYVIRQILQQSANVVTINTHAPGEQYKILNANNALQMAMGMTSEPPLRGSMPTASATIDMTKTCYVKYNTNYNCQNCVLVRGNIGALASSGSRIRWMVFQEMPTPLQPWWTTAVQSGSSFSDQIYYKLPDYSTSGDQILNNYNFMTGFIEDRDSSGEIRDLVPLKFSDGSQEMNIGNLPLCL